MKKLLFLTMMCLFGLFSVNAQETITIGEKTNVDAQFPMHTWWEYSYSQQIYTRSEINHGAANILKIAFFTDGTNYTRDIKVYMQNVTKGGFSSKSDWIDVTDADIVFEGKVTTSSVMEITLDAPFAYTGGNLLLSVHDITGEYINATSFDVFDENSNRTICMYDEVDRGLPGTENSTGFKEHHIYAKKNVLQITFDGEGVTPEEPGDGEEPEEDDDEEETTTLAAPVVTATASNDSTIVLTWEAVEGATKYYIYENDEVIGETANLFCEFRDLEANTEYCFTVTAANDTLESEMSAPACAKTLDVALPEEPGDGEEPEQPEQPADSAALAAPTNLRAYIRQDVPDYNYKYEITMAWDAVEGAQGYDVFVNTTKEKDFYLGYTGGTAYVAGSNEETTFEFYIVAFNQDKGLESAPSEICKVTVVDDAVEEMTSSFNIYPNPVNDKIYIETESEVKEVVVYDVYGRVQNLSNSATQQLSNSIDVTDLNSGVYFVKVVTENGEAVKRIIKN